MFQLLPCSNCQRTFSIRHEVSEQALLKCPNCGNQFRLGDLLDAYYAPWEVLENPSDAQYTSESIDASNTDRTAGPSTAQNLFGVSPSETVEAGEYESIDALELVDVDDPNSAAVITESTPLVVEQYEAIGEEAAPLISERDEDLNYELEPDDSQFEESTGLEMSSATGDEPNFNQASGTLPRKRRRESSAGIWSVIQVVLGGAASIPVTLLLLWYVVGKDVANAGPTVAQYVPWIVPQKFRTAYMPDEPASRPNRQRVAPPAPGESGFRNFDDVLPPAGSASGEVADVRATETEPGLSGQPAVVEDTASVQAFESIAGLKAKIGKYDASSKDAVGKVKQITAMFDDLAKIAEYLAEVSTSGDTPANGGAVKLLRNELRDVGRRIIAEPDLENFFKLGVRAQFNGAMPRTSPGRVFWGTIKDVTPTESGRTLVHKEPAPSNYELSIDLPNSVASSFDPSQRSFILGTIEEEPAPIEAGAPKQLRVSANFHQAY